jgi:hypothetical protein
VTAGNPRGRAEALAFVTAFVTLFAQILVHRMASLKLLNNLAFLVISLTMLGFALSGVALSRWLPAFLGIGSENAAHRIAVEWDDHGVVRTGVYIPRRDSSSLLNRLAGGRLFPGVHHYSRFKVRETADEYRVEMSNADGTRVSVEAHLASGLPDDSVFGSLSQASEFFARGSLGYSATTRPGTYDGLELHTLSWDVKPLAIRHVESSFFADESIFPSGSAHFDCALLMRHIPHEWHGVEPLTCCATPSMSAR